MLDRLNVRLMMITIGPAITEFLRDYLFDFNDAATRAEAKSKIENYLEGIKGRRGISFYAVVCDETNNSSQDIDEHKMNIWAIICPNNSIERIVFPIALVNNSAKLENVYQQI
jgi:phage tail sheath protein FI